jgi:hypothetical protein
MTFDEWLKLGYDNGWVGPDVCETHDGVPMSASEEKEFEDGDPCIHIVRLYESTDIKRDVEENHSPSIWRATNKGW